MKNLKLAALFAITTTLFSVACNTNENDPTVLVEPYSTTPSYDQNDEAGDAFYARDNLDLNAVGSLLESSTDAANFEYRLNSDNRVNNIDLNGDGYVDYISVVEYEDRDTRQRGFTLYDRFGLNDIQEIASLVFDWDRRDRSGIRIVMTGNRQIYGDDYYYETNWNDRQLPIADWAFRDRDTYYSSPYYYDNYPPNYAAYQVVETSYYVNQLRVAYPTPLFIKTGRPAISDIRIRSTYKDRSMPNILAKLAKPSKEQEDYRNNNKGRSVGAPAKDKPAKSDDTTDRNKRSENETRRPAVESSDEKGGKPEKTEKQKTAPKAMKANAPEKQEKSNKQGKPKNKAEKENGKTKNEKPGNEAAKPGKRT